MFATQADSKKMNTSDAVQPIEPVHASDQGDVKGVDAKTDSPVKFFDFKSLEKSLVSFCETPIKDLIHIYLLEGTVVAQERVLIRGEFFHRYASRTWMPNDLIDSKVHDKKNADMFAEFSALLLRDKKNPRILWVMGFLCEQGLGTKQDIEKAKKYYLQSAELGEYSSYADVIHCCELLELKHPILNFFNTDAKKYLQELKKHPTTRGDWLQAVLLEREGKYEEMLAFYKKKRYWIRALYLWNSCLRS